MARHRHDDGREQGREMSAAEQGGVSRSAADVLLASASEVIGEWMALMRPAPWSELPPPRLVNSLPIILPHQGEDA